MRSPENVMARSIRLMHYYPSSIWRILSVVFVLTLALSLFKLISSPSYEATCKVTTLPSEFEIMYTQARMDVQSAYGPAMVLSQTHTEFLLSRTIAEEVVAEILGEGETVEDGNVLRDYVVGPVRGLIAKVISLASYGKWADCDEREALISKLQRRTNVKNVPGSFIMGITVTWGNPETAARASNLITERYVELTKETNREQMRVTREFISQNINETKSALSKIEKEIEEFKQEKGFYAGKADIEIAMEELSDYASAFNMRSASVTGIESELEFLDQHRSPGSLVALQARQKGLQAERESLEKVMNSITERLQNGVEHEREYLSMYRAKLHKEASLMTLYESLIQTQIAEASQISSVKIIDPARPPLLPARPNLLVNLLSSLLVGIFLSAAYVVGKEHFAGHIRTPDDFDDLRSNLLGMVPFVTSWAGSGASICGSPGNGRPTFLERVLNRAEMKSRSGGAAVSGESWAETRARLFHRHIDHIIEALAFDGKGKTILFESNRTEKGKSFITTNLARRAAAMGRKVLLIDANTLQPAIHNIFGKSLNRGVYEVVTAGASIDEVKVPVEARLDMVTAGNGKLDGSIVWSADVLKGQIDKVSDHYDLIIVDTPAFKSDPFYRRMWALGMEMVCVFDAMSCTKADVLEVKDRTSGFGGKVAFVLNRVKYSGDHLYSA